MSSEKDASSDATQSEDEMKEGHAESEMDNEEPPKRRRGRPPKPKPQREGGSVPAPAPASAPAPAPASAPAPAGGSSKPKAGGAKRKATAPAEPAAVPATAAEPARMPARSTQSILQDFMSLDVSITLAELDKEEAVLAKKLASVRALRQALQSVHPHEVQGNDASSAFA